MKFNIINIYAIEQYKINISKLLKNFDKIFLGYWNSDGWISLPQRCLDLDKTMDHDQEAWQDLGLVELFWIEWQLIRYGAV